MSEIRSAQDLDDLELLRKTQPQWKSSRLEPFLQSAQQNVDKPIWGKLTIPDSHLKAGVGGGGGTQGTYLTWNVIVGGARGTATFDSTPGVAA